MINYFKGIFIQYDWKEILLKASVLTFFAMLVDEFNVFNTILDSTSTSLLICACFIFLVALIYIRSFSLLKLKSINYVDYYNFILFLSILAYILIISVMNNRGTYIFSEKHIVVYILLFTLILIVCRCIYYNYSIRVNLPIHKNTFDLKQLYENTIPDDIHFFLLNDDAVDYDLLNRGEIIEQIAFTIKNCHNDNSVVMALKGPWGSGKTTVLKNVKTKIQGNDCIVIDDFEPWIYSDEQALFIDFFDRIMKEIKNNFSIKEIRKFESIYLKTFLINNKWSKNLNWNDNIDLNRIKKIINDCLKYNNKRIVFILDNLERCANDSALIALNAIHNLLDYNRMIFVLSYDELAMKRMLNERLKLDDSYLEKIIQIEFKMPKIDSIKLTEIIKKCTYNYILHVKGNDQKTIDSEVWNVVIPHIKDLRDLKRLINSIYYISLKRFQYLNFEDMLLMEILAMKNYELWDEINHNEKFFASEDRYMLQDELLWDSSKFNKEATYYFNQLFDGNIYDIEDYEGILSYLFPNVKKYCKSKSLNESIVEFIKEGDYTCNANIHKRSILEKRVYNTRYFKLYFNKSDNIFTQFDYTCENLIKFINGQKYSAEEFIEEFLKVAKMYKGQNASYLFNNLWIHLQDIKQESLTHFLRVLYYTYYEIDDTLLFIEFSAREWTENIISYILNTITIDNCIRFCEEIKFDYRNMLMIRRIQSKFKKKSVNETEKERFDLLDKVYLNMINDVKNSNINLYTKDNYNWHNSTILFDDKEYLKLVKKSLTDSSAILFIIDNISISFGSNGFGYYFDLDRIKQILCWDDLIEKIESCKDSELKEFLVYALKHLNNENVFYSDEWKSLDGLSQKYLK